MTVLTERETAPAPASDGRDPITRVLAVLVALAAAAALFMGVRFGLAIGDDSLALAETREVVLADARQVAINLNTLDHTDVEAGLDLWEQSSTGAVLEEFRTNRQQYAQFVGESKRTTEATVTDAAVAELDTRSGIARVLVGVDVEVRPEGEPAVLTRRRLQMEMTRTDDGWKVSKLAPVR